MKFYILIFSMTVSFNCCVNNNSKNMDSTSLQIEKNSFGKTSDGIEVDQFIMKNKNGMKVGVITYGGIITFLTAGDKNNEYKDIVLGYDNLAQYEASSPYFGAIIGRYGNRIAEGKFDLNGESYELVKNNGDNHLHGGLKGFDKVVWKAKQNITENTALIELTYFSKDMEEGYPGNLKVKVTYTLDNNDELTVNYEASTDKTTIVNLTQHSYFNLSGDFKNDILDHELVINANSFLPVNSKLIPPGKFQDVLGTPFDFRNSKTIRRDINVEDEQLKNGLGYDHCWVLNDQSEGFRFVASAYEPNSGRLLEIFSDEPGIQFYSGNFLDGTLPSKTGGKYNFRTGFCLETQHFPDSPNQKKFPTVELNQGENYSSRTSFKFSVR
ncbi:galactose mutarotase [Flavobacteriaceae bacterium]|nr:galactose mutarotase [Flavobacteriaceae bacterium]